MQVCEIRGCGKPMLARGWCSAHYNRWYRRQNPRPKRRRKTSWERFIERVDASGDCWEWTGSKGRGGYGRFQHDDHNYAHRWIWAALIGPIPDDATIDHLCRNTSCVNPDHMELVPLLVNLARGFAVPKLNSLKTHCKWGHEFTPDNTYVDPNNGKRACRVCRRRTVARYRARRQE